MSVNDYKKELVRAAFNTIIYQELAEGREQHERMLEETEQQNCMASRYSEEEEYGD